MSRQKAFFEKSQLPYETPSALIVPVDQVWCTASVDPPELDSDEADYVIIF